MENVLFSNAAVVDLVSKNYEKVLESLPVARWPVRDVALSREDFRSRCVAQ